MKIAIAGASGLIGAQLASTLKRVGHEIYRLVRRKANDPREIEWDPASGILNPEDLSGIHALICLSGEPIATRRWSTAQKQRIMESREKSARLLAESILACSVPPHIFLCSSAVGYYGSSLSGKVLDEKSPSGNDFLADVCMAWEKAAALAASERTRVVHLRTGIVLSTEGGALGKMLLLFRSGLGGRVGNGQQWMSWITISDWCRAVEFILDHKTISGPVNLTAPAPVTNATFTQALGNALHRPTLFRIPAPVIRAGLGEMGESLLLNGCRALPQTLTDHGFAFEHETIDLAFSELF